MARIISVHGTFAKWDISPIDDETAGPPALQWWQSGSVFEKDMQAWVAGDSGPVTVEPFEWSSANSERDRRAAAGALLERVSQIEAEGEPYCLVGHSHGGSVISTMLMRAAARKLELPNMKRWITVGTPFLEMQEEKFLFSKLPLLMKAVFVATLMLLIMFLIATMADFLDNKSPFAERDSTLLFFTSLTLTALPFVVFYFVSRWMQKRRLYFYRPGNIKRARDTFADRWLPLTHEDDEVVTGLRTLSGVRLSFFHENFAVSGITLASVFVLPLVYLWLLNSPAAMMWIADVLKDKVYDIQSYEATEPFYRRDRKAIRNIREQMMAERRKISDPSAGREQKSDGRANLEILRNKLKNRKREVRQTYRNHVGNERALRFKQKFLERPDGTPCRGGKLCKRGESVRINSRLLFHLVTDEVARIVVDEDVPTSNWRGVLNYALPILLVPVVFIALAIALVKLVQSVAGLFSRFASHRLDALTWDQLRRTALGNDTEAEMAVGAITRPYWIEETPARLPRAIGDAITSYSNEVTADSLSKFRNAISELAFADRSGADHNAVLKFFTWRELVHASYFEVVEFRKLLALAVARQDGFRATDDLTISGDVADYEVHLVALTPDKYSGMPAV